MQRIYARISIQVTGDHAEHRGEVGAWGGGGGGGGGFVCIDICVCVCVCV